MNHFVQRLNLISVTIWQTGKAADDGGKKFDHVTGYAKEGAHPIKLSHEENPDQIFDSTDGWWRKTETHFVSQGHL
jgi:hypothetical protein